MVEGRLASDERLAQLVARGNERAFALLYERHHVALYRYCRSIVRNEEDAQDALQSAVMRALAALRGSERDIAVRPWLFRIVHNEAISLLRRRPPSGDPIDERELAHVSVERTVEERERLATLVSDIQALGERQRAALLMRELSGLSIEEIAASLSTTPGAAKQALFEARTQLHELAEGRAMECETVRRTLSERDGRVLRGRKLRAHLRACAGCVQFRTLIDARGADLRALVPPLPAAGALAAIAHHAADIGAGHGSEAVASASVGGTAAASIVAKAATGVAVMAAATAGTVQFTQQRHVPSARAEHSAPHAARPHGNAPSVAHRGGAHEPAAQRTTSGKIVAVHHVTRVPPPVSDVSTPREIEAVATVPAQVVTTEAIAAAPSHHATPAAPEQRSNAAQSAPPETPPGQAKQAAHAKPPHPQQGAKPADPPAQPAASDAPGHSGDAPGHTKDAANAAAPGTPAGHGKS